MKINKSILCYKVYSITTCKEFYFNHKPKNKELIELWVNLVGGSRSTENWKNEFEISKLKVYS